MKTKSKRLRELSPAQLRDVRTRLQVRAVPLNED